MVWFTWLSSDLLGTEMLVRGFFGKRPQIDSMKKLLHISVPSTVEASVEGLATAAKLRR